MGDSFGQPKLIDKMYGMATHGYACQNDERPRGMGGPEPILKMRLGIS